MEYFKMVALRAYFTAASPFTAAIGFAGFDYFSLTQRAITQRIFYSQCRFVLKRMVAQLTLVI